MRSNSWSLVNTPSVKSLYFQLSADSLPSRIIGFPQLSRTDVRELLLFRRGKPGMVYTMRYCGGVNVRGKAGFGEQLGAVLVQSFTEAPACEEH